MKDEEIEKAADEYCEKAYVNYWSEASDGFFAGAKWAIAKERERAIGITLDLVEEWSWGEKLRRDIREDYITTAIKRLQGQ